MASRTRTLTLLGNYRPDEQWSMLGYEAWLAQVGRELPELEVRAFAPPAWLGAREGSATGARRKVDKFALGAAQIAARRNDIVHVVDHANAWYANVAHARATIVTCHDLIPLLAARGELAGLPQSRLNQLVWRASASAWRRANRIVCTSENTRRDVVRLAGVDSERTEVVHNPIDSMFTPMDRDEALAKARGIGFPSTDGPVVLHLGAAMFYKNRRAVVRIFARARPRLPNGARLVMIGPREPAVDEEIRRTGLEDAVVALPRARREDLRTLYCASSALLFPSLYEGFGWPVIEAQACGIPVVCSTGGSLGEVAANSAATHAPADEASFAESLVRVLGDATFAAGLRTRGLENVTRFSFARFADGYKRIYRAVCSETA